MNSILRALIVLTLLQVSVWGASRGALWKSVAQARSQGLPQTAITNLQLILEDAMKEKAFPEAVKALGEKIVMESAVQGALPEERIVRLQAAIAQASPEMKPMLDTLLAHWYWDYFRSHRWHFLRRTATAQAPGEDFTTWDLPRLFTEIDRQFQTALAGAKRLQATPVADWDALLTRGTMPDAWRPTLYDFIAHEALEFYLSGEQAGARREDAFELAATDPIFDSTEAFLAWQPDTTDTNAIAVRALRLYQNLLRFHQSDPAPRPAFAAVDLERLTWGDNAAAGGEKEERYKLALERFIREQADLEIAALGLEKLARVFQREDDLVKARETARRGARLFPKSAGGRLCQNLVAEIEAPELAIRTERVWNDPWPDIRADYRNLTNVFFRAVAYDWEAELEGARRPLGDPDEDAWKKLVGQTPALEWTLALPATLDYRQTNHIAPAPSGLAPGSYYILASARRDFSAGDNRISVCRVWVSELALVTRERAGRVEGLVVRANSGEPIAGAEILCWHRDRMGAATRAPGMLTDANGAFSVSGGDSRGQILLARFQGQSLAAEEHYLGGYEAAEQRPAGQTVLFTDRAIYRPGQIVQYKGICLWVDQAKDDYEVLKGERVTVAFRDANGAEIASEEKRANDYGSFSGSFTAPRDRALGAATIVVSSGRAQGMAMLRIEEYKRPKFEVKLGAPKQAAKLNERVQIPGEAVSYTGAPIDGAAVNYRVVRETRMPWWWGFGRGARMGRSQEIAHGTARTGTDGSFVIEFTALPDLKTPEKEDPTFIYSITADVTDNTGETRSDDRTVRLGYTALQARLSADEWQVSGEPVAITVRTLSSDDEPRAAEGTVRIHELVGPAQVRRGPLRQPPDRGADGEGAADESGLAGWPAGKLASESGFTTGTNGQTRLSFKLAAGAYRATVHTMDRFGKQVTGRLDFKVIDPEAAMLKLPLPHLLEAPAWQARPGVEFLALWGTGYDTGRAFVEIEHRGRLLRRYWTEPGRTQQKITLPVTEAMRGGFTLRVTQVRENRAYLDSRQVEVPWSNKALELKWEHFVSKLTPGQKETWTLAIHPPKEGAKSAEQTAAELAATLYDASLDAFAAQRWPDGFHFFRKDFASGLSQFGNAPAEFQQLLGEWTVAWLDVEIRFRSLPPELRSGAMLYAAQRRSVKADTLLAAKTRAGGSLLPEANRLAVAGAEGAPPAPAPEPPAAPKPDWGQATARKNLNETAFFFPHLTADSNGVARITFTMPEALTRWRFLGFAHDAQARSGLLEGEAVTSRDLMVQPNPPRFLREGDTVEFTVKITNQSDQPQRGRARLTFALARDGQSADALLGNPAPERDFDVPARQSRGYAWRIRVPDGCGFLTYQAVAAGATVSDGEEGALPVLSRRVLVTESLPLPVRGPGVKKFEFTKLLESGRSRSLRNQSLTVQMVSQPAWYAVLALPYLMEYPHECAEQVFNRLYANALARLLAGSDPKIRKVFEQWRNTPALDSPLENNAELKSVAIEETPWLRQAQSESQARRRVGVLFDENRLDSEIERARRTLAEMQLPDGSWPWFAGGPRNDYISLYIVTGFGRLRRLGVELDAGIFLAALERPDVWMSEQYARIQRAKNPGDYVPNATDALYLYGRSFFLRDRPLEPARQKMIDFYLRQARKFWLRTESRQTQAHLALALKRWAAAKQITDSTPAEILASLKERSVTDPELGRFWRDTERSWWWYRAPIETQALMIEAFDEIAGDAGAVEDCQVWLLKQKQAQDWKTTKATADAVYALLLRGRNLLASDALVELKLDGIDLTPGRRQRKAPAGGVSAPEAGTGFYEARFTGPEIKPALGRVTVRKSDPGIAWGGVHWQYLEDLAQITPYAGSPLKLKKSIYRRTNTASGPVLEPVTRSLAVGDELVTRLELRADRDMEFVHLKDQRGSGVEPLNVLSSYHFQDGLGYYETTRDTASHFFIDYLPKGVYVFEYASRAQLRGEYQTGVAEIQCLYAPEFNSHSESFELRVR